MFGTRPSLPPSILPAPYAFLPIKFSPPLTLILSTNLSGREEAEKPSSDPEWAGSSSFAANSCAGYFPYLATTMPPEIEAGVKWGQFASRCVKELPIRSCRTAAFSHGGHLLAAANGSTVSIYNSFTCEQLGVLRCAPCPPSDLAPPITPDDCFSDG